MGRGCTKKRVCNTSYKNGVKSTVQRDQFTNLALVFSMSIILVHSNMLQQKLIMTCALKTLWHYVTSSFHLLGSAHINFINSEHIPQLNCAFSWNVIMYRLVHEN